MITRSEQDLRDALEAQRARLELMKAAEKEVKPPYSRSLVITGLKVRGDAKVGYEYFAKAVNPSTCPDCRQDIHIGEAVQLKGVKGAYYFAHVECPKAAQR